MTRNEQFRFGSSRLAGEADMRRARLRGGITTGPHVGFFPGGFFGRLKPLNVPGDAGLLLVAGAGTGKGTGFLVYNTVLCPGPLLVNDPKGELSCISIRHQQTMCKSIYCLNPCGLFDLPRTEVDVVDWLRPGDDLIANTGIAVESLLPLSSEEHSYFEHAARRYVSALLLWDVVQHGHADLNRLWSALQLIQADPDAFKLEAARMMMCEYREVCSTAMEIFTKQKNAPEEFGAVIGTVYNNLCWLSDPRLQAALSSSGVSMDVLCKENCFFSVCVPADLVQNWGGLIRLVFVAAMHHKTRSPSSPSVLMLLDECGQLGNFEAVKRAFTYGRGAGIRPFAAYQDIGQIEKAFGRPGLVTLMESAGTRIFSGFRTYETARLVSSMIGTESLEFDNTQQQAQMRLQAWQAEEAVWTGRADPLAMALRGAQLGDMARIRTAQQRAVMLPEELLQLGDSKAVIFHSGKLPCPPIIAHKLPYFKASIMRGKYSANPYHLA